MFKLKQALIKGILGYCLLTLIAYLVAPNFLFPTRRPSYQPTAPIFSITTKTKHQLAALFIHSNKTPYVILYSHGNAGDIGVISVLLRHFKQHGFSVLAYDYSGYGHSSHRPSVDNTYDDIEAAYHYLTQVKHIAPQHIIAYGHSLGTGPTLELALHHPLAGIIIEGGFVNAYQVMTVFNIIPFSPYKNLKKIPKIKAPVLVIHAEKDRVVPLWHGKQLYQYAPQPKFHYWAKKENHNSLIYGYNHGYWQAILQFRNFLEQRANRTSQPPPHQ